MIEVVINKQYTLDAEGIDAISEDIDTSLLKYPYLSRKDIFRIRLSTEDILLRWKETVPSTSVQLRIERRGKHLDIALVLNEVVYKSNPLEMEENDGMGIVDNIMATLGIGWLYQFDQGKNIVYTSVIVQKSKVLYGVMAAVFLAFMTGVLLRNVPYHMTEYIQRYILDVLLNYISKFLTAVVSPMMFLAILGGVLSVGTPRYLQKKGQYICRQFFLSILTVIVCAGVVCAIVFPFHIGFYLKTGVSPVVSFFEEIIPDNIFSPFIECNMIQIIFMAVVTGAAMLFLQRRVQNINHIVEEANIIICKIISGFEVMIPLVVYLSMVNIVLTTDVAQIFIFLKMFLSYIIFVSVMLIIQMMRTARKKKISMKTIWKHLKKTAVIQLASASSSVAFTEAYEACEQGFDVDKNLVNFALPIGTVIHKPFIAAEFIFFISAAAGIQDGGLNISRMLLLLFLAFVVSVAYPPVSGGEISCYTILLVQMGLPSTMLIFACTISSLLDFLEAPANTLYTECQIINISDKMQVKSKVI